MTIRRNHLATCLSRHAVSSPAALYLPPGEIDKREGSLVDGKNGLGPGSYCWCRSRNRSRWPTEPCRSGPERDPLSLWWDAHTTGDRFLAAVAAVNCSRMRPCRESKRPAIACNPLGSNPPRWMAPPSSVRAGLGTVPARGLMSQPREGGCRSCQLSR